MYAETKITCKVQDEHIFDSDKKVKLVKLIKRTCQSNPEDEEANPSLKFPVSTLSVCPVFCGYKL